MTEGYKDLIVWRRSMELAEAIYALTAHFPPPEQYGIVSQMRRSAVSIPSNIAEGSRRIGKKEFRQFLAIAFGSGSELETQIELSQRLKLGRPSDYTRVNSLLDECMKMLSTMLRKKE